MIKLDSTQYENIKHLIKSRNELSVLSVLNGILPGEVYANSIEAPRVALIQTSECNLIAGSTDDVAFNCQVSSELDFWDQLTPDTTEWMDIIPTIHKNQFIRKYKRRRYVLDANRFIECSNVVAKGFYIAKVNLEFLKQHPMENSEKILQWVENWGDEDTFNKYGTGYFIHNNNVIVSWSLSDCSFEDRIAIGIHTDERYKNKGFGKIVVSKVIKDCFAKGYKTIEWLCVDSNKGSIAMAQKLGFIHNNDYYSFSSYPPIENVTDLSETEWHEWAQYLENASQIEDQLIYDCLFCYIKSNDAAKTIDILKIMQSKNMAVNYPKIKNFIVRLQSYGMGSNFNERPWIDFLNKNCP